jgi:hypothetical protein
LPAWGRSVTGETVYYFIIQIILQTINHCSKKIPHLRISINAFFFTYVKCVRHTIKKEVLVTKTKYLLQKQSTGYKNEVLVTKTKYWLQKQCIGYKTKYWLQKQSIGYKNKVLVTKTMYWLQKQSISYKKVLVTKTYWLQKQSIGYKNKVLVTKTKYWLQKRNIGYKMTVQFKHTTFVLTNNQFHGKVRFLEN